MGMGLDYSTINLEKMVPFEIRVMLLAFSSSFTLLHSSNVNIVQEKCSLMHLGIVFA